MRNFTALLCFSFALLHAQTFTVGTWKNYTSMKNVRAVASAGTTVWAATSGGAFAFDTATGRFTQYNNSQGLSSNDLQAIGVDASKRVWVGASDGSIGVYDPSTAAWTVINGIQASSSASKGIHNFFFRGDSVFIASDCGISVFKIAKWEFGDTYASIGFSSSAVATVVVQNQRVWAGTSTGVASADLSSPYLSAPSVWKNFNFSGLLSTSSVTSMAIFHDTLVVGTPAGAVAFYDTSFQVLAPLNEKNIVKLNVSNGTLYVLCKTGSGFEIDSLQTPSSVLQPINSNTSVAASDFVVSPSFFVGTSTSGIVQQTGSAGISRYPNGPNSNTMPSLIIDPQGVLWAGTLPNGGGTGFFRFNYSLPDSLQWKNFTSAEYPLMRSLPGGAPFDDYYWVSNGANGSVWASSWGDGVVEVVADTIRRKYDYFLTPSFPGAVPQNQTYVVTGGAAVDNEGRTWIANLNTYLPKSLLRLDSDTANTVTFFNNQLGIGWFYQVVIDQNDTKWMTNSVPSNIAEKGLYYLNENNLIAGTASTDGWGYLSTADGLPDNAVLSLALDLNGSLWVGTAAGAVIISDPSVPGDLTFVYPLQNKVIQSIAVDGMNRKWVGTKEGVVLLNEDGSAILQSYSTSSTNGLLANNDVRSIAIDHIRGIVYFGTENGLSSLSMGVIQPHQQFSGLMIYPNPFFVPANNQLTIQNLAANSIIKILTVSGVLVTEFNAQGGGQAFWDGKNDRGEVVSSGIYVVVAYTKDKKNVAGKVAVIRH